MTIEVDITDIDGNPVALGQRVSLRVSRRSGSYSGWWRRSNVHHFPEYWLPGAIEFKDLELRFEPDKESERALAKPMGREQITQVVDYLNSDISSPRNLRLAGVPDSGKFEEIRGQE